MQAAAPTVASFLNTAADAIINPLIYLAFAVAVLIFIVGIVQFIRSDAADGSRSDGKKRIVWGLVGMFIMFSAYGIVKILIATVPGLGESADTGYINFNK